MSKFLISYAYHRDGRIHSFHYEVIDSIEEWIDETQEYNDGPYVLVFVMPITNEQAKKWFGDLK